MSAPGPEVCVVGFVSFQVFVPPIDRWPEPEQQLFVRRMPVGLGGALTVASVLRALGQTVSLATPLGKGFTSLAARHAIQELALELLEWPASSSDPALSLVLSTARDRSFVSAVDFDALGNCPPLPRASWIHVSGLREARLLAPRLAEARARGSKISVAANTLPDELQALGTRKDQPWDLLLMNGEEATIAAGDLESAPRRLEGAAKDVVVTVGKQGAFGKIEGKEAQVDGHPIQVVDPTGAGDAFAAGYLTARLRGKNAEQALSWGVRAAEVILSIRGAIASEAMFSGNEWA